MSNRTSLRLRVLPRFPARIVGANGLDAERDGTDMVIKPDFGVLVQIPSVSTPETTYFWGWDQSIDMYSRISFQDLVSNIQDVIIGPTTAAMEATTPGANQFIYFTGPDAAAVSGITSAGRDLLDDADAASQRATLGLGSAATQDTTYFATATQGDKADSALQPSDIGTVAGTVAAGDDTRIVKAIQYAARSGDTNSTIQDNINGAASGSSVLSRLSGDIALDADVVANGRVPSFDIDPGTVFTGTGNLPIDQTPTSAGWLAKDAHIIRTAGTDVAPHNKKAPITYIRKVHGTIPSSDPGYGPNSALMVTMKKVEGDAFEASNSVIFTEAYDVVGNPTGTGTLSFAEGGRFSAYGDALAENLLLYGSIFGVGCAPGATAKILAGAEADVQNNATEAPTLYNYNPVSDPLYASFNGTASGNKKITAYFVTNPFVTAGAQARVGFLQTGTTDDAAFAAIGSAAVGVDLGKATLSQKAVILPNNKAIAGRNTSGTDSINIAYIEQTTNNVVVGNNAPGVTVAPNAYFGGRIDVSGTGVMPTANNTQDLGNSTNRFRNIYATNNVINTSDAKLKKVRGAVSDSERAAAKSIPIKVFQYVDAISEKGDRARFHVGATAQEVVAAFEAQGLDPWSYGVVGKDPEMKRVRKTRVISRQVMVDIEEEYIDYVEKDGGIFAIRAKRVVQQGATKELPLFDEEGSPQLGQVNAIDEEGILVFDEVRDGDLVRTVPRKVMAQMTKTVPVTEEIEEVYFEDEPTGEDILSVRYEQLAMFMIAALRE